MCWNKEAEEAMKRRKEKNTSWDTKLGCKGCGAKKLSQYNPMFCNDCIRNAFDVIGGMEK